MHDEVHAADPARRRPDEYTPEEWGRLSEDEQKAVYDAYKELNETPGVSPGLQLQPPEAAATVRVQDARP
jgi:hypothetical protein